MKALQPHSKYFNFQWVLFVQIVVFKNTIADHAENEKSGHKVSMAIHIIYIFFSFTPSFLQQNFKSVLRRKWQLRLVYAPTGCYTNIFLPKVLESLIMHHRNTDILPTSHGPFSLTFANNTFEFDIGYLSRGQLRTLLHYFPGIYSNILWRVLIFICKEEFHSDTKKYLIVLD